MTIARPKKRVDGPLIKSPGGGGGAVGCKVDHLHLKRGHLVNGSYKGGYIDGNMLLPPLKQASVLKEPLGYTFYITLNCLKISLFLVSK